MVDGSCSWDEEAAVRDYDPHALMLAVVQALSIRVSSSC